MCQNPMQDCGLLRHWEFVYLGGHLSSTLSKFEKSEMKLWRARMYESLIPACGKMMDLKGQEKNKPRGGKAYSKEPACQVDFSAEKRNTVFINQEVQKLLVEWWFFLLGVPLLRVSQLLVWARGRAGMFTILKRFITRPTGETLDKAEWKLNLQGPHLTC